MTPAVCFNVFFRAGALAFLAYLPRSGIFLPLSANLSFACMRMSLIKNILGIAGASSLVFMISLICSILPHLDGDLRASVESTL